MKLTPLDIRQKRFETQFRGLSPKEVEGFLERIASEFEELVKENISLKEELKRSLLQLDHHLEKERTLQETMVTAQKISEELKVMAKKEAEIVLADAERQAEKLVEGANKRRVEIMSDIHELKRQRVQFESQVRSVIDAHQKLIEAFSSQKDGEPIEDKLSFFGRRRAGSEP